MTNEEEIEEILYEAYAYGLRTEVMDWAKKEMEENPRRADEFTEAVEWTLARGPTSGTQIKDNPPIWFIPMVDSIDNSTVAIFYTFDDEKVWLLSILKSHLHEIF